MSNHINNHVVLDLAKKVLRVVTSAKISSKKRKPITDRIKELTLSAGDFSQFNLNRKSSSHDSLNHVTLTSDLPESTYTRNNSNFIDQTPDIIKDIPPEIKNSPPNDTTDESSKEKLLLGTVQWSLSVVSVRSPLRPWTGPFCTDHNKSSIGPALLFGPVRSSMVWSHWTSWPEGNF